MKRWQWGDFPTALSHALSLFDVSREGMIWGLRSACLIGPNPPRPRQASLAFRCPTFSKAERMEAGFDEGNTRMGFLDNALLRNMLLPR